MNNDLLVTNGYLNKLHYAARRGFFTTNDYYYSLWLLDLDSIDQCLLLTQKDLEKAISKCHAAIKKLEEVSIDELIARNDIGKLFQVKLCKKMGKAQFDVYDAVIVIDSETDDKYCLFFSNRIFKDLIDRAQKNIDYIPKKCYKGSM